MKTLCISKRAIYVTNIGSNSIVGWPCLGVNCRPKPLSLPSSAYGVERKYTKRHRWKEGQGDHSPGTITDKPDSEKLMYLLPIKDSRLMRNKPFPDLSLFPGLNFIFVFLSLLPLSITERQGMSSSHLVCHSLLLTLHPCFSGGSLPQATVLHELLQHKSFKWRTGKE